jgi:outer membrane protein assembly factor BamB
VYAGTYGGAVTSFNKYTGEELLHFQAPVSTTWGGKSSPRDFFIEDGRLFVYQNGYAVFNATTGVLFYQFGGYTLELGDASINASESSYIFMSGATRRNPNNGEILWGKSGSSSDPAVPIHDKIILWNYNPDGGLELGQLILCIDASSGATIWSYDVSSPMYQPKVYNGLVLFGAYDGNFYGLQLDDGSLAWKTHVTNQNNRAKIVGNDGRDLTPVVSPIEIVAAKNVAVWSFAFIQNGWGGVIEYTGTICGLDATTGNLLWSNRIENNASISSSNLLHPTSLSLVLLNDYAFLTIGSDLYIVDTLAGTIFDEKKYDHYLLEPTTTSDMVFVAEELHLKAYR